MYVANWFVVFWCGKCTLRTGLLCSGAVSLCCKLVCCVLVRYVYVANWFVVFWCGMFMLRTGLLCSGAVSVRCKLVCCVFAMEFNLLEI